jgi:hypothetical protein
VTAEVLRILAAADVPPGDEQSVTPIPPKTI